MKYIITGDWHLTDKKPENRIDDYEKAVLSKLLFIFETAKDCGCDAILQPGDMFDNPKPSYEFFCKILDMFNYFPEVSVYTIMGQHDLKYRNEADTALVTLHHACENVHLLKPSDEPMHIQGCSWGQSIPDRNIEFRFSILLIHKMIIDKKLWEDQEGHEFANNFLKNNKYHLVVSGDNHKTFHLNLGNQHLFNMGSLLRSTIDQTEHEPSIIAFDTEYPEEWEVIKIPIEPSERVFQLETIVKQKERNEKLEAFVEGLTMQKDIGLSFVADLMNYEEVNKIPPELIKIRRDSMVEV